MANTRSAAKRARQTEARTLRNRRVITSLKTQLKKTGASLASGAADAKESARQLVSTLDKAVKSGRIHRNKANRHKSKLAKKLSAPAK
jgi:small subunit ribosomal protein S20